MTTPEVPDTTSQQDGPADKARPPLPTNSYAITALVTSLVMAPVGIVFGHVALRQIKRTGEAGRGLAIGGLVIGYLGTLSGIMVLVVILIGITSITSSTEPGSSHTLETSAPSEVRTSSMRVSYKETPAYEKMNRLASVWDQDRVATQNILLNNANMRRGLSPAQIDLLDRPLLADFNFATSQDIENISTYQIYDATSQPANTTTPGLDLLELAMDPRNPHINNVRDEIRSGKLGHLEIDQAISNYQRLQNFNFLEDSVADGMVIEDRNTTTAYESISIYEFVRAANGHEEVVLRNSYERTNLEARAEVIRLFGNK